MTAPMISSKRLVTESSELHRRGRPTLDDLDREWRPWNGTRAHSDMKLHDALLALAMARRWPGTLSNALEPGWVATKMGGPRATDDLDAAHLTQVWLAVSDDPSAIVTGGCFFHQRSRSPDRAASDVALQDSLTAACERMAGVAMAPG